MAEKKEEKYMIIIIILVALIVALLIISAMLDVDIRGNILFTTSFIFVLIGLTFILVGIYVATDSSTMEAEGRELILMRDGATDPNDILEIDWRITAYNKNLARFQKQQREPLFFGLFISETIQEIKRIDRSFEIQSNE